MSETDAKIDRRRRRQPNDYKVVQAAIMLCRSAHQTPSATLVIRAIQAVGGKGMRKTTVCALMRQFFHAEVERGTDFEHGGNRSDLGNRSGTAPEPLREDAEPISSTAGTESVESGTAPEHHARVKTKDKKNGSHANPARRAAPTDGFGELETYVARLLAGESQDARSDGRLTQRRDLLAWREQFGAVAFEHGIRTALQYGAGIAAAFEIMERFAEK